MKNLAVLALGTFMLGLPDTAPFAFAQSTPVAAPTLTEVRFDVPDMTCALCPLTVKTAMSGVDGVQSVEVDFDSLSATVIFDHALTDAAAIAEASAQAGYPAAVRN
ncbi:MAG: cation transporter [Proteobacteria bacterium]|nr:cation transporter [Pseudomonadota bacterium]